MNILERFISIDADMDSIGIAYRYKHTDEYRYDSTPIGAYIFASSGVGGTHYCIVQTEGKTLLSSPVYCVSPMSFSEGTVCWVAANITDFIKYAVTIKSFNFVTGLTELKKAEIDEFIESIEFENLSYGSDYQENINTALITLKEELDICEIDNIYEHVTQSYNNPDNHAEITFGEG